MPSTARGPVPGSSGLSNIPLAESATGLTPFAQYEYQVCGNSQPGLPIVCVGPNGGANSTDTFLTVPGSSDWPQFENTPDHRSLNFFETTINTGNVNKLTTAWVGVTGTGLIEAGPAVANGEVYVGSLDGKLYAFRASCGTGGATCTPDWIGTTGDKIWGTPAVANGVVYIGSQDRKLYAFPAKCGTNAASCSPLWTATTGGAIISSPAVANGVVYIASDDQKLYAFPTSCTTSCNPSWTGAVRAPQVGSTPAVAYGKVYITTAGGLNLPGLLYAFSAACGGGVTCQPQFTANIPSPTTLGPPAVANSLVYVAADYDKLYAFDAGCGTSPCPPTWTGEDTPDIGNTGQAGVAVDNHAVFVPSGRGLKVFPASGCGQATCAPLWTDPTTNTTFLGSSPAVANGLVYAGNLAYSASGCGQATCTPLASWGILGRNSPVVANGKVYLSAGNKLTALTLP